MYKRCAPPSNSCEELSPGTQLEFALAGNIRRVITKCPFPFPFPFLLSLSLSLPLVHTLFVVNHCPAHIYLYTREDIPRPQLKAVSCHSNCKANDARSVPNRDSSMAISSTSALHQRPLPNSHTSASYHAHWVCLESGKLIDSTADGPSQFSQQHAQQRSWCLQRAFVLSCCSS